MSQHITRNTARAIGSKLTLENVIHDKANSEFYVKLDQDKAVLQYSLSDGQGIIDMQHTVVPPVFRGMGVAKLLAETAFEFAVQNRYQMKLTCWYLQEYLEKNPKKEYKELVLNKE